MTSLRKDYVDSALLTLNEQLFLMPTVMIAEVLFYTKSEKNSERLELPEGWLGYFLWRDQELPFISLSLETIDMRAIKYPKVAIINAQFQNTALFPAPFFAALFENKPQKVRIRNNDLSWLDQKYNKALLKTANDIFEVTLFDVAHYRQAIENMMIRLNPENPSLDHHISPE